MAELEEQIETAAKLLSNHGIQFVVEQTGDIHLVIVPPERLAQCVLERDSFDCWLFNKPVEHIQKWKAWRDNNYLCVAFTRSGKPCNHKCDDDKRTRYFMPGYSDCCRSHQRQELKDSVDSEE